MWIIWNGATENITAIMAQELKEVLKNARVFLIQNVQNLYYNMIWKETL